MPKRQVLLLLIMGLVLAYAAYDLLLPGKGAADPQALVQEQAKQLEAVTSSVKELVDKDRLTDIEAYRLTRISEGAATDPLVRNEPGSEGSGEKAAEVLDAGNARFAYSGLIALGERRLAVINDSEYKPGELVGESGFKLMDIRPDAVVLQGRNPENGTLENVVVPIQDDIINFVEEGDAKQ